MRIDVFVAFILPIGHPWLPTDWSLPKSWSGSSRETKSLTKFALEIVTIVLVCGGAGIGIWVRFLHTKLCG